MWTICGKAQFPHSFERIVGNYLETVLFQKISTSENWVKLLFLPSRRFENPVKHLKAKISPVNNLKPLNIFVQRSITPKNTPIQFWNHKVLKQPIINALPNSKYY